MIDSNRIILDTNGIVKFNFDDIICYEYDDNGEKTGYTVELNKPIVHLERSSLYLINNFHPHVSITRKTFCLSNQNHIASMIAQKRYESLYWAIEDYLGFCNTYNVYWSPQKIANLPCSYNLLSTHIRQEKLFYCKISEGLWSIDNCLPLMNGQHIYPRVPSIIEFYNSLRDDQKDLNLIEVCYNCGRLKLKEDHEHEC